MNVFFRICVSIYAFLTMLICAVVMISPFGEKNIMNSIIEYADINFYRSNAYDAIIFVVAFVFFLISLAIFTSGLKAKKASKFIDKSNDNGTIRISTSSIENIALAMSKRFQGVKDSKAKAEFRGNSLDIFLRLQVLTDVNIPELSEAIQERVKESVENTTEIKVNSVVVSVDGVIAQDN